MNIPTRRLELQPESEPARTFIEALVARYKSQIEELKQEVQSRTLKVQTLAERIQKLCPRTSSVAPCTGIWHMAKTIASGVSMTNAWLAVQGVLSLKSFSAELAHLR
jgi:hypothetical protein